MIEIPFLAFSWENMGDAVLRTLTQNFFQLPQGYELLKLILRLPFSPSVI